MLRILHLCDQNWVGTASTFVKWHNKLGNYSRMVTLSRCRTQFEEDICLDLPAIQGSPFDMRLKRLVNLLHGGAPKTVEQGGIRVWRPRSGFEALLFRAREAISAPKVRRAIERYHLLDFDIYHLEGGTEFYKDGRTVRQLKALGKRIVCYYIGTDLRERGLIPEVDRHSDLNITTEFDHLSLRPGLRFSFLPFEVYDYRPRQVENKRLRICHAPRNRFLKGTERIVEVAREMERKHGVEFVLIEGKPHREAIEIKKTCDIAVDQITDLGGTGYGVNSLETLSMGIPTLTSFTPDFEAFLKDHPFVVVNAENLPVKLEQMILDPNLRRRKGVEGRRFVEKYHAAEAVVRSIYAMYRELGWVDDKGDFVPSTSV